MSIATATNIITKLKICVPKANQIAVGTPCSFAKAGSMKELSTADNPMIDSIIPKAREISLPLNHFVSKTGTAT